MEIIGSITGISTVYFDDTDVVRHPLVQSIIRAYGQKKHKALPLVVSSKERSS